MDMSGEENLIEPIARITDERLKYAVGILQRAQDELVQERLKALAHELDRLLGEIEMFDRVVYCGKAAACLLDNGVLRMLAGSVNWRNNKISKDVFWNKPSPAAEAVLGRKANGWKEWKYRTGRSIKEGRG